MKNQPNNPARKTNAGYDTKISRFFSRVLRHSPEIIRVTMDKNGWVDIQELIKNANALTALRLNIDTIKKIVAENDKQRFIISGDGKKIRANQGHSIPVDLELKSTPPPDVLYHGTAARFLDSITRNGLKPMSRQYVHLSRSEDAARAVGKRHGEPVILRIDTKAMSEAGYTFYLSENQVWLTGEVPAEFITPLVLIDNKDEMENGTPKNLPTEDELVKELKEIMADIEKNSPKYDRDTFGKAMGWIK